MSLVSMLGFTILMLLSAVQAHMQLHYPPPFNASNNPHTQGPGDDELLFPHNCCGKKTPYPCRGYLSLLGTPEGASVATWAAGSQQSWSLAGPAPLGGNHYGGSCQIGFSTDKGKTFRTAVSYEGNCPHRHGGQSPDGQQFPFNVPADLPAGDVVFAFIWINREQEFFMNCAAVTITGGSPSTYGSGGSAKSAAAVSSPAAAPAAPQQQTFQMGDCKCTCPPGMVTNPKSKRDYTLSGCNCLCPDEPALAGRSVLGTRAEEEVVEHGHMRERRYSNMPFQSRPLMFIVDPKNGCNTPRTTAELQFPDPGPDVVQGDGEYPLQLPTGNCGFPGA